MQRICVSAPHEQKNDPEFVAQFGTLSQIYVGKIVSLSTAYPAIKSSATSWKEIDKKHRTWILLAALHYDSPVKLQRINPEAVAAEAEADVERDADD